MSDEEPREQAGRQITTGGGAYAEGDVRPGGDFVGRDKITHIHEAAKRPLPLQHPIRAEHFTDRETELAHLLADLQPSRVVTLTGPGGIGKSALAAEAVWQLAPGNNPPDRFPDGIIFHSFYNQPQADLALEKIALAYGEEPRPTPRDAAQRALAGRQALLILDGTEAADNLSAVLEVRDQCGVIVTSRQRQDAVAERQDLSPLAPEEALKLVQAWGQEQVQDQNAAKRICELVGWLPLAVRLVGRYLAATEETAGEYLAWLEETPLEALDQGQQRMDSVSVLLQETLSQVSETARQVLGVVGLLALAPFRRVRQPLGELVSFGLLLRSGEGYEVSHALIHTYAREQVRPEAEVVQRLGEYYTTLVKAESRKGLAGYHRLAREREHVMRVLAECARQGDWEAVRSLVTAVKDYLRIQGYWTELATALEMGIKAARGLGHRPDETAFLGNLGANYYALGEVKKAIAQFEQALTIAREIGDRQREAKHLAGLGRAYRDQGEVKKAIAQFEQALTIAQELGDRQGEGICLGDLGGAYNALGGQVQRSIEYYEQALTIFREIGDRLYEGAMLGNLGLAYRSLGQIQRAIEYHEQGLTIAREFGHRQGEGNHLGGLGGAYRSLGKIQRAIEYLEQALTIAREIGRRHDEGVLLGNLGATYRDLGQVQRAIEYLEQAVAIFRKIGDRRHEGFFLFGLGNSYLDLGQVAQAIELFEQTLVVARQIGDRHNEGNHLGGLGNAYRSLGQVQRAIEYYEQALIICREIGLRLNEREWLGNLGLAYSDLGEVQKAIAYYEQALTIAQEIGDRRGEGNHLGNLGIAYRALGEVKQARDYLEQSLAIFEAIQSPNADLVREWLDTLNV
jgi:tetratricopeptide (TPR) repeat protein